MDTEWISGWPVLVATVVGPIVAVMITLVYQRRDRVDQLRLMIFTQLMQHRRQTLSREFVGGLNQVPIAFCNHKAVLEKFDALMQTYNNPAWFHQSGAENLAQQVNVKVAQMLSEMAKVLKMKVSELTILHGSYSPDAWARLENMELENRTIAHKFLKRIEETGALPVMPAIEPVALNGSGQPAGPTLSAPEHAAPPLPRPRAKNGRKGKRG